MVPISAVELNFLIFRYHEGTGFKHSAFTLGCEAGLSDCPLDRNMVPPTALVRCIQKGLEYLETEANLSNMENDLEEDFSFIRPLDLITKDVDELKQMIMERRENRRKHEVKLINGQHEARSSKGSKSQKMVQITALELNFLILRYLEGSGFKHSAFTLGCEAGLSDCPLDRNMVPPAALVRCIQKGLEYLEMEANLSNRENDLEEDFSLIRPLDLITKDVDELKQMIMERRENRQKHEVKLINGQHEARSSKGKRSNHDNVKEHEKRRQPTRSGRKNGDSREGHKMR